MSDPFDVLNQITSADQLQQFIELAQKKKSELDALQKLEKQKKLATIVEDIAQHIQSNEDIIMFKDLLQQKGISIEFGRSTEIYCTAPTLRRSNDKCKTCLLDNLSTFIVQRYDGEFAWSECDKCGYKTGMWRVG